MSLFVRVQYLNNRKIVELLENDDVESFVNKCANKLNIKRNGKVSAQFTDHLSYPIEVGEFYKTVQFFASKESGFFLNLRLGENSTDVNKTVVTPQVCHNG